MASLTPSMRRALRFAELLPSLKRQCDEKLGSFEEGSEAEMVAELTRALLYLWLYFEEECTKRAYMVRCISLLFLATHKMSNSPLPALLEH